MSASSKKKLRKEQESAFLTQKQQKQAKEAKKDRIYTMTFVIVLILVAAIAVSILGFNLVNRSGYFQNKTIALSVGPYKLSNTMFNYYYMDAISEQYSEWSDSYGSSVSVILPLLGFDPAKPLDKQIQDEKTGTTWAEFFIQQAIANARYDYAMANMAEKDNYTLSDDEMEDVKLSVDTQEFYAMIYGYSSLQEYLEYSYGFGSNKENYTEYCRIQALAQSYYNKHKDSLEYDDAAIREYEGKENRYNNYTNYTYTEVYLSYRDFLGEGTKDENGTVTYTKEQNDAAAAAAKVAAESLLSCKTSEELKTALLALKNGDKAVYENEDSLKNVLTEYKRTFYGSVRTLIQEWVSSSDRKSEDINVFESSTTNKDEDGNDVKTIGGYYVVLYHSTDENKTAMSDVRHLLVAFEGGTQDEDGNTVYSDDEKKKALDEAEKLLKEFKEGKADVDAFIELVKNNTDDTASKETGGLYENIYTDSNYVENFKNWALDAQRKAGDVEIVESPYGYHIMYYVGASELNYRDYMISNDLRDEEIQKWAEDTVDSIQVERGNMKYIDTGMTLS